MYPWKKRNQQERHTYYILSKEIKINWNRKKINDVGVGICGIWKGTKIWDFLELTKQVMWIVCVPACKDCWLNKCSRIWSKTCFSYILVTRLRAPRFQVALMSTFSEQKEESRGRYLMANVSSVCISLVKNKLWPTHI